MPELMQKAILDTPKYERAARDSGPSTHQLMWRLSPATQVSAARAVMLAVRDRKLGLELQTTIELEE
jgi:hypothetical protein